MIANVPVELPTFRYPFRVSNRSARPMLCLAPTQPLMAQFANARSVMKAVFDATFFTHLANPPVYPVHCPIRVLKLN